MSLMNYVLDGGSDTQGEGTLLRGCLDYWKASGAFIIIIIIIIRFVMLQNVKRLPWRFAAVCAKTAEPIEMPFGGLGD